MTNFDGITKENFIEIISTMSPEDITKFISEKGKKPKLVKPLIRVYNLPENGS